MKLRIWVSSLARHEFEGFYAMIIYADIYLNNAEDILAHKTNVPSFVWRFPLNRS